MMVDPFGVGHLGEELRAEFWVGVAERTFDADSSKDGLDARRRARVTVSAQTSRDPTSKEF
jgi:hypothetical protein